MGLFDKILSTLGIKKEEEKKPAPTSTSTGADTPKVPRPAASPRQPIGNRPVVAASVPKTEMPMVDVMGKLETMAKGTSLDWKVSIVDLLKVLGIESSLEARKELATELGCPPDKMGDSAKMNVWLHKTVLKKISENGGNIPKELLD